MTQLISNPDLTGLTRLFYVHAFRGRGPTVIVTSGSLWNGFLLRMAGIHTEPFHTRPSLPIEPDAHANGHPFAWMAAPDQFLLDEARLLPPAEVEAERIQLRLAIDAAREEAEAMETLARASAMPALMD